MDPRLRTLPLGTECTRLGLALGLELGLEQGVAARVSPRLRARLRARGGSHGSPRLIARPCYLRGGSAVA